MLSLLQFAVLSLRLLRSAFEGCSENQSEVFEKWLDENASEYLTEDEMKDLKEKINTMTADMDSLNAKEGYRGTSYESVFLLSASEAVGTAPSIGGSCDVKA